MVFSSLLFTFFFLPIIVILYYLSKEEYKNYILLAASLIFYSYGEPKFIFVMLCSIVINYILALIISIARMNNNNFHALLLLVIDIIVNLGVLFCFKYLDFTISIINSNFSYNFNIPIIPLPIGISFFTFQAMSYVIDVYRNESKVQTNILNLGLYISFFPQLVAGPIVRYSSIENQILYRSHSYKKFAKGFERFLYGFSKKILIANNLSIVAEDIFSMSATDTNPIILWLGSLCFTLQIFYDFSGYSDMAIGLGKMFGFEFDENFNYPYIAKSITDFWRRWHISLSQWFRDYVYIPLGGSRVSVPRHIFNLFVVWSLTGIWHGANFTFMLWGVGYFFALTIEKYIIKPESRNNIFVKIIWRFVTLVFINFAWVIFNSPNINSGIKYCIGMFCIYQSPIIYDSLIIRYFREYGIFILCGVVFSLPVSQYINRIMPNFTNHTFVKFAIPIVNGILFIWSTSFLILGAHNPFIYFNF